MIRINIRQLESPKELASVEDLQRLVWQGSDIEVVPVHMLLAALHGGGVLIGAYDGDALVGFVFGFPGSDYRDSGLGFKLKRAQWQMVRQQGLNRITWTYDPLQSRNAMLNITKLGAVCSTYYPNYYGKMRDQLNMGLPSDRFQVDWWVNSPRVNLRLSKSPRKKLDLAHYLSAGTARLNETEINDAGIITPRLSNISISSAPLLLLEIPTDFQLIKTADPILALEWRMHTRTIFHDMFAVGYLVTDFIFLPGSQPRSYYVLSFGESTL